MCVGGEREVGRRRCVHCDRVPARARAHVRVVRGDEEVVASRRGRLPLVRSKRGRDPVVADVHVGVAEDGHERERKRHARGRRLRVARDECEVGPPTRGQRAVLRPPGHEGDGAGRGRLESREGDSAVRVVEARHLDVERARAERRGLATPLLARGLQRERTPRRPRDCHRLHAAACVFAAPAKARRDSHAPAEWRDSKSEGQVGRVHREAETLGLVRPHRRVDDRAALEVHRGRAAASLAVALHDCDDGEVARGPGVDAHVVLAGGRAPVRVAGRDGERVPARARCLPVVVLRVRRGAVGRHVQVRVAEGGGHREGEARGVHGRAEGELLPAVRAEAHALRPSGHEEHLPPRGRGDGEARVGEGGDAHVIGAGDKVGVILRDDDGVVSQARACPRVVRLVGRAHFRTHVHVWVTGERREGDGKLLVALARENPEVLPLAREEVLREGHAHLQRHRGQ
mmetsp:Transcript_18166/g.57090  ORF Transcript_18166/g.57090 Transcript_18166/m.57090 type:complete len:458 (-) Transcript_18166:8198-9571(-)